MSRPQVTKKNVLSAIGRLSGLDKQNEDTWNAVRDSLEDITDDENFATNLSLAAASLKTDTEKNKGIARATQAVIAIIFGIQSSDTSVDKSLEELIRDNHSIGNFELKIDEATIHGRITNQLKKSGADVDSTQSFGTDDITKIKEFFQENGKEILGLFTTVKITPEALRDHIKKHLTDAFAAFQEIKGDSISSKTVKGLIETLANVGEAAKAAVGLGNDFSTKEDKEKLLKKIKEKLPDTSDDILITAAAAAFNTTKQVVRFEQAQKAEVGKIIGARKAPTTPNFEDAEISAQTTGARRLTRTGNTVTAAAVAYSAAADKTLEAAKSRDNVDSYLRKSAEGTTANQDAQKKRTNCWESVKTLIAEGNLIAAIKNFKETREAQTQRGIKIEAFEENYLKFVMAALDIAGIEGKPELKAALLDQVSTFHQRFLDKAKANGIIDEHGIVSDKAIGKGVEEALHDFCDDEKKKNLIKPLEKAGIVNVREKLITARGFQDLAIHRPSTTQKLQTKEVLKKLDQIFKKEGQQPVKFEKLPWWHQDLMQKYAPVILAGQSPLPTSVKRVLEMSVSKEEEEKEEKQDQIKPPHPLLVKIASFPFVKKAFPRFVDEINERCGTRAAPKNIGREERAEEFSDSYSAAKEEITPPKEATDVAAVSVEHVVTATVARSTSVADPSKSEEGVVAVVSDASQVALQPQDAATSLTEEDEEKARKEMRRAAYQDAGFDEEKIDELEEAFKPPAIAGELAQTLNRTRAALEAARDGASTPVAAPQLGGTESELGKGHSSERPTTPNTPLPAAPSPVEGIARAREEGGKVLSGLADTSKSALADGNSAIDDDAVSDDEMACSAFANRREWQQQEGRNKGGDKKDHEPQKGHAAAVMQKRETSKTTEEGRDR